MDAASLAQALALAFVVQWDNYWMLDNEDPHETAKVCKNVSEYVRQFLAKNSDGDLGLGATEHTADGAASREALYVLLRQWQARVEVRRRGRVSSPRLGQGEGVVRVEEFGLTLPLRR